MQGLKATLASQVTGVEVERARDSIAVMKPQEIDYTSTLYAASVEIAYLRKVTARRMKLIQDVFNADEADALPSALKQRMAAEFDGFETPNTCTNHDWNMETESCNKCGADGFTT